MNDWPVACKLQYRTSAQRLKAPVTILCNGRSNLNVGFGVSPGPAVGRKRVLVNGCLLETQRNANHPSFVNFGFAATPVLQSCDLTAPKLSMASRFRRAARLLIFRQSEHPPSTRSGRSSGSPSVDSQVVATLVDFGTQSVPSHRHGVTATCTMSMRCAPR